MRARDVGARGVLGAATPRGFLGSPKELAEAPGRGLRASEEVLSGLRGALSVPAAGAPLGKEEVRGPLRPAGPGCHLYRGRSHLRLWLAQEAGTLGRDARPRAFGGRPQRCVRGREHSDVAANAAAAAEETRSPRVSSRRPPPSDPEDQTRAAEGRGRSLRRPGLPELWERAGAAPQCLCGWGAELQAGAGRMRGRCSQRWGHWCRLGRHQKPQGAAQNKPLLPASWYWEDSDLSG
jgi:hypothetical protein